ncbi:hypothetical protein ACFO26_07810 [Lactococcus nasutitermitis]|uniref:Uncharacterized protein n=1 Tax=Lactococcus nasutitermitis TaxID=1652957 RepID=A0ABV9JDQ5_9LACT|nr:hypothetical protein [Lactococcus nasutitermitis]
MKKHRNMTFYTFLVIISLSCLGILFFTHWTKPTTARFYDSFHKLEKYNQKEIQDIELAQLMRGDFSSIQGKWHNEEKKETKYIIDGNLLLTNNKRYYLSIGGLLTTGAPYIKINSESEQDFINTAPLSVYPVGKTIPIMQADGSIDNTGKYDPSDLSKERLLLAQSVLTSEKVKEEVCYRE